MIIEGIEMARTQNDCKTGPQIVGVFAFQELQVCHLLPAFS